MGHFPGPLQRVLTSSPGGSDVRSGLTIPVKNEQLAIYDKRIWQEHERFKPPHSPALGFPLFFSKKITEGALRIRPIACWDISGNESVEQMLAEGLVARVCCLARVVCGMAMRGSGLARHRLRLSPASRKTQDSQESWTLSHGVPRVLLLTVSELRMALMRIRQGIRARKAGALGREV